MNLNKKQEERNGNLIFEKIESFKSQTMKILDRLTDDLKNKINKNDVLGSIDNLESNFNEMKTKLNINEIKIDTHEKKIETLVTVDETRDAIKELRNDFSKNL